MWRYLSLILLVTSVQAVTYQDIVEVNKTCPMRDSCRPSKFSRMQDNVDWSVRNCFCDDLCGVYGDCCVDAKHHDDKPDIFACKELRQFGFLYMKSVCPADWKDSHVRDRCENFAMEPFGKVKDPIGGMPVTSQSGITYSNFYCAMCNDAAINATIWQTRLECPELKIYQHKYGEVSQKKVYEKLRYNEEKKIWGIDLEEEEDIAFYECFIDPVIPETVQRHMRQCKPHVDSCPEEWKNETVKEKCQSYSAYVYCFVEAYRNAHCAICNNITIEELFCEQQKFFRVKVGLSFDLHAFSMLLDVSDVSGAGVVGQVIPCEQGQLFDPFFKKCRSVWCNEGSDYRDGRCASTPRDITTNLTQEDLFKHEPNVTETDVTIKQDLIENNYTLKFRNRTCPKVTFYPGEYQIDDDSIVTINGYDRLFRLGHYTILSDGSLAVCAFEGEDGLLTIISKFDESMAYVTAVGIIISVVCLFIHLVAFFLVPDLKNLSGKNMACLSVGLLLAYILFLLGQLNYIFSDSVSCTIVGAAMYYFFLSSFFWMNVLAYDVWRTLKMATTELRSSSGRQTQRFISYCAYGWFMPALLLGLALVCDYVPHLNIPVEFTPGFGENNCWFSHRWALLVFFATPLGCVMMGNIILFLCSSKIVFLSSQESSKLTTCTPRINLKLYIKLAILMGLTWTIGLVAGFLDSTLRDYKIAYRVVWYSFILLNTLQGLFIFIAFTCTKKVADSLVDRWIRGKAGRRRSLFLTYSNNSYPSQKSGLTQKDSSDSQGFATGTSSIIYTKSTDVEKV